MEEKSKKVFKWRKVTQFHIEIVEENMDKILRGELNRKEMLNLINEEAKKVGQGQIKYVETVSRIVFSLLSDKPEELEQYKKVLKSNRGRRNQNKGKISSAKTGTYYQKELEFKRKIIKQYLPKLLEGKITLKMIETELHTVRRTIDNVVTEYYSKTGNTKGLEEYEKAKKRNIGASIEQREQAKKMRQEIEEYKIVPTAKFLSLSEEEQDKQIEMKIRKEKLKEEKKINNKSTRITSKEATIKRIEKIKEYFRRKNDVERGIIYFSEQDIRYMIFVYPTIVNREAKTLDKKIEVLTSYDEIDEETAYEMIKGTPAIIGYSADRTIKQLDLLERENLIDYVIDKPSGFMNSVSLMYALIQYAKERHKTEDLSDVVRSNIFMANSTLKRFYGLSYEELKERFPYEQSIPEKDIPYTITGQEIGELACYDVDIQKAQEADKIINHLVNQKNMEVN